jgi:hypothetical protein
VKGLGGRHRQGGGECASATAEQLSELTEDRWAGVLPKDGVDTF